MATLTLRPISDVSNGFSCSAGSSGYSLINDVTSDGDSTYILKASATSQETTTGTFQLGCSDVLPSGRTYHINSMKVYVVSRITTSSGSTSQSVHDVSVALSDVNGSNFKSNIINQKEPGTSYTTHSGDVNLADDYGVSGQTFTSFTSLKFKIKLNVRTKHYKNSFEFRITQVYLVINYDLDPVVEGTGFYVKKNGSWVEATKVYKKINGVYQEIDPKTLSSTAKYRLIT